MGDVAGENKFAGAPVLVTGGAGFIGSHLVERLANAGASVTVVDNLQAGRWANLDNVPASQLVKQEADVREAAAMRRIVGEAKPRFVFHLAANASVPGSVQDPTYDYEANASGTFVVLNALREAGADNACEKAVIASSGAVYGEPRSFPIGEEDLLRPISPYGASKLCAEVEGRMFVSVYHQPVVIARIFNSYGPRMARFVILDFLKKLRATPERLEVLGTGQQVRDFTYVADTVAGLMNLATGGVPGESYNISSGTTCSVRELAEKIIAARGLTGTARIECTGTSWVGDAQRWEVAIDKLRALGYAPRVTLPEGLERTIDWFDATFGAESAVA